MPSLHKITLQAWVLRLLAISVWGIGVLYYLYEYIQRVSPSLIANNLMEEFHVTAAGVGNLNAIYFYAYAIFQIPTGYLADRFGPKWPLLIASIICSLGGIIFSLTHQLHVAELARGLIGVGSAFGYLCCIRLTVNWFDKKYFGFLCGLLNMMGLIGGAFGGITISHLLKHTEWRPLFFYMSMIGLALSLLILIFVSSYPRRHKHQQPDHAEQQPTSRHLIQAFKTIIRSKQVWLISLFAGTTYCSFDTLAAFWGVSYLKSSYHLDLVSSSELNGMIFIGGIFGFLIFGWLTTHTRDKHRLILLISSIALLAFSIACYLHPNAIFWLRIDLLGVGFFSATIPVATDLIKTHMPTRFSGLTISILNFTLISVGAISQPLFGFILEQQDPRATTMAAFTSKDFHQAFLLIPAIFTISFICVLLMKQTRHQTT